MKFDRENGRSGPGQKGRSPNADQTAKSINRKRSRPILRLAARDEAQLDLSVEGDGWECIDLGPYVNDTPVGMAVLPVTAELELIVFVSARRKRGGS